MLARKKKSCEVKNERKFMFGADNCKMHYVGGWVLQFVYFC